LRIPLTPALSPKGAREKLLRRYFTLGSINYSDMNFKICISFLKTSWMVLPWMSTFNGARFW
jgi:hypothetical protein